MICAPVPGLLGCVGAVPNLSNEQEYLFTPYSVFSVRSARWASGKDDDPHVIELDAAPDNVGPSEDLPLAMWS